MRFSIVVLLFLAAACGDGGSDPSTDATGAPVDEAPAATEPAGTAAAEDGSSDGPCPTAAFTGTIERTVEAETGDGTHVVTSRSDSELATAYAYYFGFGGTYTVYVGDFEIDEQGVGSDTLTAPAGGLLATIFIQSEEELTAGMTVEFGFVPIVDSGGGASISGFGVDDLVGLATIIAVTDEVICFDIDTSDPQQEIHGTVSAQIVR